MKGVTKDGKEVVLRGEQEQVVRYVLYWHRSGRSVLLPDMGRQASPRSWRP